MTLSVTRNDLKAHSIIYNSQTFGVADRTGEYDAEKLKICHQLLCQSYITIMYDYSYL